jgi:2-oxoglutarate ferredoxin oxidoreductase subunit delta
MKNKYKVKIDEKICKGCGLCIIACPRKILKASAKYNSKGLHPVSIITGFACSGCGFCYIMCPDTAIEIIQE